MKRLTYLLLVLAIGVVVGIVSYFGYKYVKEQIPRPSLTEDSVSVNVQVEELLEQVNNPKMTTPESVVEVRNRTIEQYTIDSVFLSMPTSVVINVANVVIGRQGNATKKDIVQEFMKNYDGIYKHLKAPDPLPDPLKPETIKVPIQIIEIDTIINGNHVKLLKTIENG